MTVSGDEGGPGWGDVVGGPRGITDWGDKGGGRARQRGGLRGTVVKWRHSYSIPRGTMHRLWGGERVAGPWK